MSLLADVSVGVVWLSVVLSLEPTSLIGTDGKRAESNRRACIPIICAIIVIIIWVLRALTGAILFYLPPTRLSTSGSWARVMRRQSEQVKGATLSKVSMQQQLAIEADWLLNRFPSIPALRLQGDYLGGSKLVSVKAKVQQSERGKLNKSFSEGNFIKPSGGSHPQAFSLMLAFICALHKLKIQIKART